MPRLFIAIDIEPSKALVDLLDGLRQNGRGLRVVQKQTLHLTLAFLGETDPRRIEPVASAMRDAVDGLVGFDLPLRGLDLFGTPEQPRVLLTRPAETSDALPRLNELAERIRVALGDDLPADRFGFTPHLTLARASDGPTAGRTLAPLLAKHGDTDFGTYRVDSVGLYGSELSKAGPTYTQLASAPLGSK
ncbi:MAG: RNA 2',3'-cyclic phosphodiesterase [Planctomycetota bacterium]